MEEDYSGGDETVVKFSSDERTAKAAKTFNSQWADEQLSSLRETRRLRRLAVYIYGAAGMFLIALSSCLAWRLFELVVTSFQMISHGLLSGDNLPSNGYIALLATVPVVATMIAGVSVIAISMKAIKAANSQDSHNENGADNIAAVMKSIIQQQQ